MFWVPNYALLLAVSSGVISAILLYIAIVISEKTTNKKYSVIEKELKIPFFYKSNGNFIIGNNVKNGNIYFCESGIVFVSVDVKPHAIENLSKSNIDTYKFENLCMTIYTKDGKTFLIMLPNAKDVLRKLQSKNWLQ